MEVFGPTGEEIGDVENLVIGPDGRVPSVIAEVGGFLDLGDTHVNVPFERIAFTEARDGIIIPVTQETIEEFSLFPDAIISAPEAAADVEAVEEDPITTPRTWLASELIGDYARLRGADVATAPGVANEIEPGLDPIDTPAETAVAPAAGYMNYGYVDDLIIRDGQVAAVVVSPDVTWGARGLYAMAGIRTWPRTICPLRARTSRSWSRSSTSASRSTIEPHRGAAAERRRCPTPAPD